MDSYTPNYKNPADRAFAKAIKDKLKAKFDPSPNTPMDRLTLKAQTVSKAVHDYIQPIVQAGGSKDRLALQATLFTMFVQAFDSTLFTKEELIHLLSMMHVESMMVSIDADPSGMGTPDHLSGV
jgi:hypothetical protein